MKYLTGLPYGVMLRGSVFSPFCYISLFVFFCGHTQLMMEMLKVCAASMCALEVYLPKENLIFGIVMSL